MTKDQFINKLIEPYAVALKKCMTVHTPGRAGDICALCGMSVATLRQVLTEAWEAGKKEGRKPYPCHDTECPHLETVGKHLHA
ncbi:MAG TPA: hypothetical protein VLC46_26790 [Thermoanaerobaculia bacterium]|jgi:hypothetical protein|nr:hypothetical protein [Thermoanaerobaculia bacterium]